MRYFPLNHIRQDPGGLCPRFAGDVRLVGATVDIHECLDEREVGRSGLLEAKLLALDLECRAIKGIERDRPLGAKDLQNIVARLRVKVESRRDHHPTGGLEDEDSIVLGTMVPEAVGRESVCRCHVAQQVDQHVEPVRAYIHDVTAP